MRSTVFILPLLVSLACRCAPSPVLPASEDDAGRDGGTVSAVVDGGPADASVSPGSGQDDAGTTGETPDAGRDGGAGAAARPYRLKVPKGYDATRPTPLVVLLHGYGGTGAGHDSYFRLSPLADARTFLLATPDGTPDSSGRRFWNATEACCNFENAAVDDVANFNALVDEVQSQYNVDPKRIFVIGHSNGGFMALRLACEVADRVAGVVSLAGAGWKDSSRCKPAGKVAVLQVHGSADGTIRYDGGSVSPNVPAYPSALETINTWAKLNGCNPTPQTGVATKDLDGAQPGAETRVDRFGGCTGGAAELWTLQNGSHVPALNANWAPEIYGFLSAHPKP